MFFFEDKMWLSAFFTVCAKKVGNVEHKDNNENELCDGT